MPKISVIVPVYNVEKYLVECVDSILSQTFTDFELLLIDDGSLDSSGKICDEYAERDNRIRVFHQFNQGQAVARNSGVQHAAADWIHFVDSDDIIHPQMLEILYNNVQKHKVPISAAAAFDKGELQQSFFREVNSEANVIFIDELSMMELYENIPYVYWIACAKLIKKDILLKYPFEPGRIYEDNAVVCRWLYDAGKIAITDEELYYYRTNSDSTTQKKIDFKQCDLLWAFQEHIEFFKNTPYKKLLKKSCMSYLYEYCSLSDRLGAQKSTRKDVRKLRKQAMSYFVSNFRVFVQGKYDLLLAFETFFKKTYLFILNIKKTFKNHHGN